MLLIYSEQITSRLIYSLDLIFNEVLGIEYQLSSNAEAFTGSKLPKLNYSQKTFAGALQIQPCGLLNEIDVRYQIFKKGIWNDLPIFFLNDSGDIPFDMFSAAFYLVARYEEYLPSGTDEYGRFMSQQSLASQNGFLRLPIIDLWSIKLAEMIGIKDSCPNILQENYRFQLTVDIDQPWLYKHKGLFYPYGAMLLRLIQLDFIGFFDRLAVFLRLKSDPADTYQLLGETEKNLKNPIKYFILMQGEGEFDENKSVNHFRFKKLLRALDRNKQLGIHPSYASNANSKLQQQEKEMLENILGRKVNISRQHYLKLYFPETFRNLQANGIDADYSLGYSHEVGFRSGIARSYFFFDLKRNAATQLRLFPLIIMDRTLKDYAKLEPEEALKEYGYFTETIKKVGGEFICLWHNDAISDRGEWKGWQKVFHNMISLNT